MWMKRFLGVGLGCALAPLAGDAASAAQAAALAPPSEAVASAPVAGAPATATPAPNGPEPATPAPNGPAQATPAAWVLEAHRLSAPPAMSGRLDDPVWQQAARITSFTQYEPDNGKPASERTELLVGYDSENLYFGFRCYDREPDKIVAKTLLRDGDQSNEDSVQIYLDTFHDRRNAYLFSVNPLGAQYDALVRQEGEDINVYWDGLWQVATAREATGWSAELVVPFKTLRFPASEVQSWGFNVRRLIARKQEDSFWKPLPYGMGYFGRYRVSDFGELRGLSGLTTSGRYQAVPFVLGRDSHEQNTRGTHGTAGGDLKVALTTNLIADLTVETDFAEAQADLQQINLTRFKIQYPEKRGFFLEGSNLFYFGDRGVKFEPNERFNFFFSRQIGITADGTQEVPVLGGAKITGKVGGLSVGALNLTTDSLRFVDANGNHAEQPSANYSVVRLKQDISPGSSVGLIALDKEATGDRNRGAGVDWNVGLTDRISSHGFLAKTTTPGLGHDDQAGSMDLLWQQGLFRAWSEYAKYGKDFNPEIGFLTLNGIKKSRSDLTFFLSPGLGGWLHRLTVENNFGHLTDEAGRLISQTWLSELVFFGRHNDGLAVLSTDDVEVLYLPFTIHRGVVLPPGAYRFRNLFLGYGSDYAKPLGATIWYDYGDFYDGTRLHNVLSVVARPARGLSITVTYDRTHVALREGVFTTNLSYADVTYSISPRLFVHTLVQWLRGDNFRANVLLDWTYRPDSDFYLVYNDATDLDPVRRELAVSPVAPGRSLVAKVGYRVDF